MPAHARAGGKGWWLAALPVSRSAPPARQRRRLPRRACSEQGVPPAQAPHGFPPPLPVQRPPAGCRRSHCCSRHPPLLSPPAPLSVFVMLFACAAWSLWRSGGRRWTATCRRCWATSSCGVSGRLLNAGDCLAQSRPRPHSRTACSTRRQPCAARAPPLLPAPPMPPSLTEPARSRPRTCRLLGPV